MTFISLSLFSSRSRAWISCIRTVSFCFWKNEFWLKFLPSKCWPIWDAKGVEFLCKRENLMVCPTFLAWLFHWTDSHHCTLSAAIQAQRPLSSYLSHPPHPHDCPRHLAPPQPRPSSAPSWSWQPTTHPAHALFGASWTADASSLFPRSSSAPPADSDSCCSTRPASALASTTATLRLVVLVRV